MGQDEYVNNRGIKVEGLEFVVNSTLSNQNFGFFLLKTDPSNKILSIAMISYQYAIKRYGVFWVIQFIEGWSETLFEEILKRVLNMSKEDEKWVGILTVSDKQYSHHWEKIEQGLELYKSDYYIYSTDMV